jgi:hypothetical protein
MKTILGILQKAGGWHYGLHSHIEKVSASKGNQSLKAATVACRVSMRSKLWLTLLIVALLLAPRRRLVSGKQRCWMMTENSSDHIE